MTHTSLRDLAESLQDDLTTLAMDIDVLTDRFKDLLVELPEIVERLERVEEEIEHIKDRQF